jgi:hypothetical protein
MRRARDCVLVDAPNWLDGQDEFEHIGCWYSFASWVFRKRTAAEMAATPRSAPPLWPEIMEVCVQRPLGVESSGFYPTEDHGEDGRRLRWTGAVGEISVALNPASLPRFLELKLWPITSAKGTPFRLLVNGVELLNSRVVVVPVDTVVALPNLAGMQEIHIRLEAETFEAGEGSTRRLGLAVESIALLARKQEPPPWPERLEVGVSTPPFAADSGLWAPELRSGRPLRWTKGVAEIAVDLNAETLPRFLAFKLWEITPPTGTSYRLTVDGHEVATGRIEGKPVARIVRLPDLAGRETVRIVLESPTFVTPGYEDRPMGVAVESIALLARRPDSKAWPARLEIGVDQPPVAVSSGLYPAEAHEGRPLRWTTDVSEFTVDLNPKSLPRGLQLKLWEIAPPEGAFYRVLVNGHEAMIGRVLGAPVTRSVGLPDLTGCDEIHIRLESSTFTPPGGAPDRPLGVALESLALLAKEPLAMPWPEQLEVGAEQPMFAHATGLFALEKNEGRPLRWTGGLVRVVVDINPSTPPRSLLLRLWAIAPPKGTSYKLAVNGKRLLSGVVTSRPVQDLAALPDLSGERQLVIELECDTFRGSAADTRDLGVALESIALLQSEPKFVALP